MRFRIVLAIFLVCTLVAGCSTAVNPKVKYKGTYRSYVCVLDQWTRTQKAYDNILETVLLVTATYESAAFKKVRLAEKIRAEAIPEKQAGRLYQQTEDELSRVATFFVSFYTKKYTWNELQKENPSWRLWLVDGQGRKVAPLKVERVRNFGYSLTKYYPYYDEWSFYYRVTFPRKTDSGEPLQLEKGEISLLVTGIYGREKLVWKMP